VPLGAARWWVAHVHCVSSFFLKIEHPDEPSSILFWSLLLDAGRVILFNRFKIWLQSMQWWLALWQAHHFVKQVNPEVQLQHQSTSFGDI
jgi:hypothetical protein